MGNMWCFRGRDNVDRDIAISQGIQCSLLLPVDLRTQSLSPNRNFRFGTSTNSGGDKHSLPFEMKQENNKITMSRYDPLSISTKDSLVSLTMTIPEVSLLEKKAEKTLFVNGICSFLDRSEKEDETENCRKIHTNNGNVDRNDIIKYTEIKLGEENVRKISDNDSVNTKHLTKIPDDKTNVLSTNSTQSYTGSIHTLLQRSVSAMSDQDSLDQLMSILRSSGDSTKEPRKSLSNDCLNKVNRSVKFSLDDGRSPKNIRKYNDNAPLKDGRIKRRFILRETCKLFDILKDENDRRIKSICDRHKCDLEIFVKPPKVGLMSFAVEIVALSRNSLATCVRQLDSSMKWCLSAQLC